MREFGVGYAVPRIEDRRLLRGQGRYTDDLTFPGEAHLYVVRSPHAAARLGAVGTDSAARAPGVLAVLTGADVLADGLGTFPSRIKRQAPGGAPNFEPPQRALATDGVHYVGEPVAAIVAETYAAAKDAAELVEIDYDVLSAVTATAEAAQPGAPQVWEEAPGNVCFLFEVGDEAKVDAAFRAAAHTSRLEFTVSRISANPMEPRNAIGLYDAGDERYTLYAGMQAPHTVRGELAGLVFKIPDTKIRIVSPDCGGAFGMKDGVYPELVLVLWAARRLGRPVRWQCERGEAFLSDGHARDNVSVVELALDETGHFLGLRIQTTANLGAYLAAYGNHSPTNNLGGLAGTYTTPAIHARVTGVFTNTNPTAPYRGAGRPEASYAVERVIDTAAREMGIDRAEIRRRNMIPADAMPYRTGLVFTYDSGEFENNMNAVLALSDWPGFEKRRAAAKARGKLGGIGLASVIEIAGGPLVMPLEEHVEVRFDAGGNVTLLVGTHSHGQGHETVFTQLAVDALGLDPGRIRVAFGDTDQVFHGQGTYGSRSASAISLALGRASEKIIAKGRLIASHLLEASPADIEFRDGTFRIGGTDRALDIAAVGRAAFDRIQLPQNIEPGLAEAATVVASGPTFPNGCHVCEVEVDEATGAVAVVGYWVVDDVGRVINPLLVEGQVHGGIAQGLGQALFEEICYAPTGGQLLSGSFLDYCMPRADDMPGLVVETREVPAKTNPLGIKGCGEAGTIGALPAVMNAVVDALAPLGVRHLDMPASPENVWRAIRQAGNQ